MATRYEIDDDASPENMLHLIITKGNDKQSGQPTIDDLCTLVKWNDVYRHTLRKTP